MAYSLIGLISAKFFDARARGEFVYLEDAGKLLDLSNSHADFLARALKKNDAVPEFVMLHKPLEKLQAKLPNLPVSECKEVSIKIKELEPGSKLAEKAWAC